MGFPRGPLYKVDNQLPRGKHETASKKHPCFPPSLPQDPQNRLRSDPPGPPIPNPSPPHTLRLPSSSAFCFEQFAACPAQSRLKDRPWAALCLEHSSWDGHMDGSFPSLRSLLSKVILTMTVPNYLYIKLQPPPPIHLPLLCFCVCHTT